MTRTADCTRITAVTPEHGYPAPGTMLTLLLNQGRKRCLSIHSKGPRFLHIDSTLSLAGLLWSQVLPGALENEQSFSPAPVEWAGGERWTKMHKDK